MGDGFAKSPPQASFLSYTGEAHSFFSTRPKRKNGGRKSVGRWTGRNVWSSMLKPRFTAGDRKGRPYICTGSAGDS